MDETPNYHKLRKKAEKIFQEKSSLGPEKYLDNLEGLLEELSIHQIEMELQQEELHEANARLQEAQGKYQELYMKAPVAYITLTHTGNIADINEKAAELLRLPQIQFRYQSIFPFIKEDERHIFSRFIKMALQSGHTEYGELTLINKEGGTVHTHLSASGFHDTGHDIPLLRCTITDESKIKRIESELQRQKQTEKALKESQHQLEVFFGQAHEGFFFMMLDEPVRWDNSVDKEKVLDYVFENQRITKINDAMLQQYQAKREDFIGITPNDLFAHDLGHGRSVWRKFFDQGKLAIDTIEKRVDGTSIVIEGEYICLYNNDGHITGHFGTQREVTNEREAARALKASEEKHRFLFENMAHGVVYLDDKGKILHSNKAASQILQTACKKLKGTSLQSLTKKAVLEDGSPFPPEANPISITLKTGRPVHNTKMGFLPEGATDYTWIKLSAIPRPKLEETSPFQMVAAFEDITDLKNTNEQLGKQNEHLNKFFNIIGHDLRSPFNTVLGFAGMLQNRYDSLGDPQRKHHINAIYKAAKNALDLTENLLSWAKTQTNRLTITPEPIELRPLADNVAQLLQSVAQKKQLTIKNQLPAGAHAYADRNIVQTILRNLLANAIKYSYKNTDILITGGLEEGGYNLCVEDFGVGMTKEQAGTLFRLDQNKSTLGTEDEKGTGLGLLISKEFAGKSGGDLTVSSTPNKGTTFCLWLPTKAPTTDEAPIPPELSRFDERFITQLLETRKEDEAYTLSIRLKNELHQAFHSAQQGLSSYTLKQFAAKLKNLGEVFSIKEFVSFSLLLEEKLAHTKIGQIQAMLKHFEAIDQAIQNL